MKKIIVLLMCCLVGIEAGQRERERDWHQPRVTECPLARDMAERVIGLSEGDNVFALNPHTHQLEQVGQVRYGRFTLRSSRNFDPVPKGRKVIVHIGNSLVLTNKDDEKVEVGSVKYRDQTHDVYVKLKNSAEEEADAAFAQDFARRL